MQTIRAEIVPTRELFRDDESGFKIYSADVKSSSADMEKNNYDNISLKGNNLPDFNIGAVYDLELEPNTKDKYKGSYTMVKSYFVAPQTPIDQWKFLSMVVTEIQYANISSTYKENEDNIIDVILEGSFDYEAVKGYGETTYAKLKENISMDLNISEALAYFSEYDISYNVIRRMVVLYGTSERAIAKIEENPYALIDENGFGFITADELAMKLGVEKDSLDRINACMTYVLQEASTNGDTWILRKKLYNKMKKLLSIKKKPIEEAMEADNPKVFVKDGRYGDMENVMDEFELGVALAERSLSKDNILKRKGYDPEEFIKMFEENNSLTLSGKQREFLNKMDKTNLLFLIGNAGTGKSLIQKVVIDVAEHLNLTYALLAPTGKASRVLKRYTGREAYTIHKRVGFAGGESDLSEDIILVDEASMCDVYIAKKLMQSIPKHSIVVFIGDDAQIPSVGVGNFLFDCINNENIEKVVLDKVFRQKESGMLDAITMTRKGDAFLSTVAVGSQRLGNNFEFRHMMQERIPRNIISSYEKLIKGGYTYDDIGVLTPTNIGDSGAIELNKQIQELVNPQDSVRPKDEHVMGSGKNQRVLRVGDYVMNTVNTYDAQVVNLAEKVDVFNGECGTIIAINLGNKDIIVDFEGRHILYSVSEAVKSLVHAWAITIHKSQGSQYRAVIAIVDSSATFQLNANLIYTAMSRAQDFLGVFGQAETYNRALSKFANFDRNSFLNEFLEIAFEICSVKERNPNMSEVEFFNWISDNIDKINSLTSVSNPT